MQILPERSGCDVVPELLLRFRCQFQRHGSERVPSPALTFKKTAVTRDVPIRLGNHHQCRFSALRRVDRMAIGPPLLRCSRRWRQRSAVQTQLLLSDDCSSKAEPGRADQQNGSESWASVHKRRGAAVILVPLRRLTMPLPRSAPRPGRWQRWRTGVVLVAALVVWLLRWIWPLQLLPGWVVAVFFAWAGVEVMLLIWYPRRWR